MAVRKIVRIDEERCNGCGQCVPACAEGAIQIVDGKARLVSDTYCDGLGACLGTCPLDAISIEERDAAAFDEAAVQVRAPAPCPGGACPGQASRSLAPAPPPAPGGAPSQLTNWPVQLKLVAPQAPCFRDADLLVAADCVAFALGDFHTRFLRGRPLVVGCPKLDAAALYVEKVAAILTEGGPASVTVVKMEVPCCSGLVSIVEAARERSGAAVPVRVVTVSIDGAVLEEAEL